MIAALTTTSLGGQSLPDGWWLQDSPEKVLARAQAINQNLGFYQAHKSGSTSSQITNPFAKTNQEARVEFFQRRTDDGFVETKQFTLDGNFQFLDFKLKSGHYFITEGQVFKAEYDDGGDAEKSIAAKFDHPYDYKIPKSVTVGTNDWIVIARCMTPKFLDAMKAILYKDSTKEAEEMFGGDYRKFIRSETDHYFRKSDGVAFGLTKQNHLGEQLEDHVFDTVQVNQPMPDDEFSLPKGDINVVKSMDEFMKITGDIRAARRAKSRQSPAVKLSEKHVSELPWVTDLTKALEKAKAENKTVLLDFTGSDWCVWCTKFDDDVLSQPEFADYAKTNLLMVMLDFPNAKPQSDSVKQANKDLQDKFKVAGFPTYVALTPDGKEIGRQVGYLKGGPQAFIAELEKFRNP